MNLDDIIRSAKASSTKPSDDDLRSLPYQRAFVYGRVSSQGQVRESLESIRDIAKLVELAVRDGYHTGFQVSDVEQWLGSIQDGTAVEKVIEDGDVIVDCRDLGLSGSLGEDKRPGLADLQTRVSNGDVGAVYLTEGMSRLSRDRDRVLGYKLLKLLKEHECRIRTPEGVYNPAIPRDWENLAEDIEDSADEMKKHGIRLGRRRSQKAAEGRHVGSPVSPGYVVDIEGQNRDGSYILGKWVLYPPHQEVVVTALRELVNKGSFFKASQSLNAQGVVFPFFTGESAYMETRSALRHYNRNDRGYTISPNALLGLATNLKLIGIWQWRDVLIENNHPAVVPVELFLQAYEIATTKKAKGRAAYAEPMDWSGLLYCYQHDAPRVLSAHNVLKRWKCSRGYFSGREQYCLNIADHKLTPPLTKEFLTCLDLSPHAEAVMEKIKNDVDDYDIEETRRRRQETELHTRLKNLENHLGSGDAEREETYWRLIREARSELESIKKRPLPPKVTAIDIKRVKDFLENLETEWWNYPGQLRNRLLKLLIDRVEIRYGPTHIEATMVWKAGFQQVVQINTITKRLSGAKRWQPEEEDLLRMLWPSSSQEALLAAFPDRSLASIMMRASVLKIKRPWKRSQQSTGPRWTEKEKKQLKELYAKEMDRAVIQRKMGREWGAIVVMAHKLGIVRPKELRYQKDEPAWETVINNVVQASSSPKRRLSLSSGAGNTTRSGLTAPSDTGLRHPRLEWLYL